MTIAASLSSADAMDTRPLTTSPIARHSSSRDRPTVRSAASMTDEDSSQKIRQWQNRLHEIFDFNGVLGGRTLALTMELERTVGQIFVQKFHGHRLLTDAFLDFFAETLRTQSSFHWLHGWPK